MADDERDSFMADVRVIAACSSPFRNCQYAAAFRASCPEVSPRVSESWCDFCQAHVRLAARLAEHDTYGTVWRTPAEAAIYRTKVARARVEAITRRCDGEAALWAEWALADLDSALPVLSMLVSAAAKDAS